MSGFLVWCSQFVPLFLVPFHPPPDRKPADIPFHRTLYVHLRLYIRSKPILPASSHLFLGLIGHIDLDIYIYIHTHMQTFICLCISHPCYPTLRFFATGCSQDLVARTAWCGNLVASERAGWCLFLSLSEGQSRVPIYTYYTYTYMFIQVTS